MTARNIQSRITKLEARSVRPNEMLVVWRLPDGDVAEALKGATFAKGDMVICAEWFDDGPLPAPTWYNGRRLEIDEHRYDQIEQSMGRIARLPRAKREADGFAPFLRVSQDRARAMTDAELIHALLGVRT